MASDSPPDNPPEDQPSEGAKQDPADGVVHGDAVLNGLPPEFAEDTDLLKSFVAEVTEHLDTAEEKLLTLEKEPDRAEALDAVFRSFHNIKGAAGFLELRPFVAVAHAAEDLLGCAQKGEVILKERAMDAALGAADTLRALISAVRDHIDPWASGDSTRTIPVGDVVQSTRTLVDAAQRGELVDAQPEKAAEPTPAVAEVAVEDASPQIELDEKPEKKKGPKPDPEPKPAHEGGHADDMVRLDASRLDQLVDTVGELVVAESMVSRSMRSRIGKDPVLLGQIRQLDKITRNLQEMATTLRMVPVRPVFQKMARMARDLGRKLNKPVDLVMSGEETQLDKAVVDRIADPLLHVIRNAIDHGLEPAEERRYAGKPETGRISVEARHVGGEVWIIIRDDGRGLDREKILNKAIEAGLVEGNGENLREDEIYRLIFAPGLSTAAGLTDISGRGVGMDVVARNIEQLRGRIDIRSVSGKGTIMVFRVPLTLAIIEGMVVRVGETRYTIPLLSVRETLRPKQVEVSTMMTGQELIRVRDEMIPVLRLHELHNRKADATSLEDGILVIISDRQTNVALLVDEVLDQQQTVIKGLSEYISKARGISGCTILGDGAVSLILDTVGLIKAAEQAERSARTQSAHQRLDEAIKAERGASDTASGIWSV